MYKSFISIALLIFLVGCSNSNKIEHDTQVSCALKDNQTGEVVMCVKGNSDLVYIKQCSEDPSELSVIGESCPKSDNYYGHCAMENDGYTSFSYLNNFVNKRDEVQNLMIDEGKKSCEKLGGKWHSRDNNYEEAQ